MRPWVSVVIAIAACGPSSKPPASPSPPPPSASSPTPPSTNPAAAGDTPVDATQACDRIFSLKSQGCEDLQSYDLTRDECIENMRRSLEDRGADARQAATKIGRCFMGSDPCDQTMKCVNEALAAMGVPEKTPLRTCSQSDVYGAVGYPRADWDQRKGAHASHFSEVPSTKDAPIEVCGIPDEGVWLAAMKCDDGSNPFHSPDAAEPARVGNVGPGGRCGAIVDLYEVACPEKTYEVYIDAYVCPLD
ncbi:MAG TPA: hypothetical protein VL463_18220 [Kofleriaceae bacterium]|nr:hypothetical protein [Kofleriaceae bacterium]